MIRLYAWNDYPNFGDALSSVIVEWISCQSITLVGAGERNKVLAVGSILQEAQDGDLIWGSGIHPQALESFWKNYPESKFYKSEPPSITVAAVRGPITRDVLLSRGFECPKIYGDPAILLPLIYRPPRIETIKTVIVPHFSEFEEASSVYYSDEISLVNPSDDWQAVVTTLAAANLVISSSLHGIIIAEAYGVPAIWLRSTHAEGMIKYLDYYLSTSRVPNMAETMEEALSMQRPIVPDLSNMQLNLISAYINAQRLTRGTSFQSDIGL